MSADHPFAIDWATLPAPQDDGAARHLAGARVPPIGLTSTDGETVTVAALPGRTVVYAYPMMGQPGVRLPEGWNDIPGARGCTPQSCAFRDHFAELKRAGAANVFGLSAQETSYQREAAERLHLPFALLSDAALEFARALNLPTFAVDGMTLLKRITLIIASGRIAAVFYPVFPPDRNASDVVAWLQNKGATRGADE